MAVFLITDDLGVEHEIGGSADPNAVTAAAVIADHAILRGAGGVRGAQDSTATIADNGVMSIPGLGTGGYTAYDLRVGNVTTPDYGMIQFGNAAIGRTSFKSGAIDLDGALLIRNIGGPVTSQVSLIFAKADGSSAGFAIAKSAVGNATYSPRSVLIVGPAPADTAMVTVAYWQAQGFFDNLACDTDGSGADLGVQNDFEAHGTVYVDTIAESTTAAGVTIDGVLLKDSTVDGRDVADLVEGPASATDGNLVVFDGATGKLVKDGGAPAGGGDVTGPASANDTEICVFDSTTGKLIKASSSKLDASGNLVFTGSTWSVIDSNGNIVGGFQTVGASAVNYLVTVNSIAAGDVLLAAAGTDTNISINAVPKGSGVFKSGGVEVVTLSDTQTLTNKSIVATQIDSGTLPIARIADGDITYAKIQNVSVNTVLGRKGVAGGVEEITLTATGRSLIDDGSFPDMRNTLGLGSAAVKDIGTSGDKVPVLNNSHTWLSGTTQTFGHVRTIGDVDISGDVGGVTITSDVKTLSFGADDDFTMGYDGGDMVCTVDTQGDDGHIRFIKGGELDVTVPGNLTYTMVISHKDTTGSGGAAWIAHDIKNTSPDANFHLGLNAFAYHTGTANLTRTSTVGGLLGGGYGARIKSDGATISKAISVWAQTRIEAGNTSTVIAAHNFYSEGIDAEDGTIDNAYGYYGVAHLKDTGTLTNAYGIYLEEQTSATTINNEMFLSGSGEIFFRDQEVHIGSLTDGHLDLTADVQIDMNDGCYFDASGDLVLRSRTDANRGAAGTAGRIIFNTDDGAINVDNGTNWTDAQGTTT